MQIRRNSLSRLKRRRAWRFVFGVLLTIGLVGATLERAARRGRDARFEYDSDRQYNVRRAVDGDTLLLESGHRVRLLGVDTPETKHPEKPEQRFGKEAADFTALWVNRKPVRLVFDRERLDRYDRVLAWVYVDDTCLNVELVRAGLSPAIVRSPLRADLRKILLAAEVEAKDAKRGIWAEH